MAFLSRSAGEARRGELPRAALERQPELLRLRVARLLERHGDDQAMHPDLQLLRIDADRVDAGPAVPRDALDRLPVEDERHRLDLGPADPGLERVRDAASRAEEPGGARPD